MGITYTQGTDPARLDSVELSERLSATIRAAVPWLVTLSDADAGTPEAEGKWSAKEILGHLTDSAINNLSRIVRMQIGSERMPGYDQQVLGRAPALPRPRMGPGPRPLVCPQRASRLGHPPHRPLPPLQPGRRRRFSPHPRLSHRGLHRPHGTSLPRPPQMGKTGEIHGPELGADFIDKT